MPDLALRAPCCSVQAYSSIVFEAMPNVLQPVQSPADVRLNVETFNSEAAHFYDRAARLLRETTYWVYDPVSESLVLPNSSALPRCHSIDTLGPSMGTLKEPIRWERQSDGD